MNYPSVYVCERCIRPLASHLCQEMLKTPLGPGIDETYFVERAYRYALLILGKNQLAPERKRKS